MANEWRDHPALQGKFHPEYPDDVQVYIHDGVVDKPVPEHVWVTVTGQTTLPFGEIFSGIVLNQPFRLQTVSQQQTIRFMAPEGFPFPFMVTENYLARRNKWQISLCPHCGMPELFSFGNHPEPGPNSQISGYKSTPRCPACLGHVVIKWREEPTAPYSFKLEVNAEPRTPFAYTAVAQQPSGRKWWQFWL